MATSSSLNFAEHLGASPAASLTTRRTIALVTAPSRVTVMRWKRKRACGRSRTSRAVSGVAIRSAVLKGVGTAGVAEREGLPLKRAVLLLEDSVCGLEGSGLRPANVQIARSA
eukprot:2798247-Pleurochrysis_carterae.AAC.2